MHIGIGIGIPATALMGGGAAPWILQAGVWNDAGQWWDVSTWNEGA